MRSGLFRVGIVIAAAALSAGCAAAPTDGQSPAASVSDTFEVTVAGPNGTANAITRAAAAEWAATITSGEPSIATTNCSGRAVTVDDLLVEVRVADIDVDASTAVCSSRPDGRPSVAMITFDSTGFDALVASWPDVVADFARHEMGHAFGIGAPLWRSKLVDGSFAGAAATAQWRLMSGCRTEMPPATGDGFHWAPGASPDVLTATDGAKITRLSLASLADIGYRVDLGAVGFASATHLCTDR